METEAKSSHGPVPDDAWLRQLTAEWQPQMKLVRQRQAVLAKDRADRTKRFFERKQREREQKRHRQEQEDQRDLKLLRREQKSTAQQLDAMPHMQQTLWQLGQHRLPHLARKVTIPPKPRGGNEQEELLYLRQVARSLGYAPEDVEDPQFIAVRHHITATSQARMIKNYTVKGGKELRSLEEAIGKLRQ